MRLEDYRQILFLGAVSELDNIFEAADLTNRLTKEYIDKRAYSWLYYKGVKISDQKEIDENMEKIKNQESLLDKLKNNSLADLRELYDAVHGEILRRPPNTK